MKNIHAKERILMAAADLFSRKGYEHVTVREIAKEAGCSHTSIYTFFGDKKQLLQELANEPLELLMEEMQSIISDNEYSPLQKLVNICKTYIVFGWSYQNLYEAFMHFEAIRVDVQEAEWELNQLRLELFGMLKSTISLNFPKWDDEQLLGFSRIIYYSLHGIIMTYKDANEPMFEIEERVLPLVTQTVHYLVRGAGK